MLRRQRVLIIGGSLGGMIAAHLLRAIGWQADVFEHSGTELESRGAGLGTHPVLLEILRRIDPPLGDTIGVDVHRVICLDRAGRIVIEQPTARTMTAWGHLYTSLRRRLPAGSYNLGRTLVRLEQHGDGVTAHFADGSRERGDLLVGADGWRSTVRAQLFPALQPRYAGYVAWRIMLDERELSPAVHREVFDAYSFCLPAGEQLLGYPVPGRNNETRAGERAYNIVWYRPVEPERALVDLLTDAGGLHHAAGIPPPLIRPEIIARVKADAREVMAPQIAEIVERSRPFFQPIYDLVSAHTAVGRVALIGDAAFVARPHLGAGVTKAALDAAGLADCIAASGDDLATALARCQHLQVPLGTAMVDLAAQEGAYLGAQLKPLGQRAPAERERDIDGVIRSHDVRRVGVQRLIAERAARASGWAKPSS